MARDWINPPEPPIRTLDFDPTQIKLPTEAKRMRECLLMMADLAYTLEAGQYMVIQRHTGTEHPDQRLFTARVYGKTEDKL
jgi:hypothetical protein